MKSNYSSVCYHIVAALWLCCFSATLWAASPTASPDRRLYRVYLRDKKHNSFSIKHPEKFLSPKALERRARYGIAVDKYDLPLSPSYLQQLSKAGFAVRSKSKWTNTAVVEVPDTTQLPTLLALPFVKDIKWVYEEQKRQPLLLDSVEVDSDLRLLWGAPLNFEEQSEPLPVTQDYYGLGQGQVSMLNVDSLHRLGYRGKDMTIAVIDGGFLHADTISALSKVKILGTHNFVQPEVSVYADGDHGTMVLSCMAAQSPYSLVGTAPEAAYWLLVSEDGRSEQLVEEDYLAAALEWADSVGVDVATASLGYYKYDFPAMTHTYAELDGRQALVSLAASLAASRGMLFLNSAGNEGDGTWKKIAFPADADHILTVGAVEGDGVNTYFSSLGYTADHRVKPDVMAQGGAVAVFNSIGNVDYVNGTSFACPLMAGAVTCLWQAHRQLTPLQMIKVVQEVGDNYSTPNEVFGYGIPNLMKAHKRLQK